MPAQKLLYLPRLLVSSRLGQQSWGSASMLLLRVLFLLRCMTLLLEKNDVFPMVGILSDD